MRVQDQDPEEERGLDDALSPALMPLLHLKSALQAFEVDPDACAPLVHALAVEVQKKGLAHLIPDDWFEVILPAFQFRE